MWEATTFSSILEMKLSFEIGRKLLRSLMDRDESWDKWIEMVFQKRLDKSLFEWRWKNFSRKREIDKVCEDWTNFIEAVSKIEFTDRSWNIKWSASEAGQMEKETDQENQMAKIWCECVQVRLRSSLCWQGRMHLETLEVSLKNFDEELCWWVSRFQGVQGLAYDSETGLDKKDSAWNFARSKGDFQCRQHRSSRLSYFLAQRITELIHGQ